LGVHFLFSIDDDVIWLDPAIGRKNNRAVAKAAFGLHPFGEIDLPVHVGYLISVSPTVSQHVKYNKTKELAERVGFEPTLEFPLNTLSKRAPSATRPSLRLESVEGTTLKKHSPSRQSWRSTARWVFSILWGKPSKPQLEWNP